MKKLIKPDIQALLKNIENYQDKVPSDIRPFFNSELWMSRARRELGIDLRDLSFRRDRSSTHEAIFESIRPLGLVGHIMPGNSEWTALLAILEGSVVGNTSWVKLPSGSDKSLLEQQLMDLGLDKSVQVFTEREEIAELYKISDAISAWGSESSLEEIRQKISAQTRFIPWGHRISFSYLTDWSNQANVLAQALVKYEQQACSSPQVVYLEEASFDEASAFAKKLANELDAFAETFPKLDESQWAELSNFSETHKMESFLKQKLVLECPKYSYRIVVDSDDSFEASVLNRSIFIKPIKSNRIKDVLAPHRRFLQTAGTNIDVTTLARVAEELIDAGVSRVCAIADMQDAHPLESHDGEFSLTRFIKRVSIHAPGLTQNNLHHVESSNAPVGEITSKNDFAESCSREGQYFFKSGGSSGAAILSPFKISDYHLQMQVAADGLIAAGLDPKNDRAMNLFFGGGLYGGFLSFTDILEKTGIPQYPMAGYLDHDFVIDTIIAEKINVLLGMPSYFVTLFKCAQERSIRIPVQKIFFGGEPFSRDQREWLKDLGVEYIRSASYGSVDAGPIGYQCQFSEGGIHHVNTSIQHVEIVNLESDREVSQDEIGRILVTSKARSGVKIQRYQIGDTGRWVAGACPCGDQSPRLELMGRTGDIFKFGGSFLNARKFASLVAHTKFQIILEKNNLSDCMNVITDADLSEVRRVFLDQPDLHEVVELEKSCKLEVKSEGYIEASSGKIPLLIDRRQ